MWAFGVIAFAQSEAPQVSSASVVKQGELAETSQDGLRLCSDEELGLRFLCDPAWTVLSGKEKIILVAGEDPTAVIALRFNKTTIRYLEQLGCEKLEAMGHYQTGFVRQRVPLVGKEAIAVKGVDRKDHSVRLLDYYFLKGSKLYSLSFSLNPAQSWDQWAALFSRVAESLEFIPDSQ